MTTPNIKKYWSSKLRFERIATILKQKEFEGIWKFLHFSNKHGLGTRKTPQFDRLYKIRPVIDILNERFVNIIKKTVLGCWTNLPNKSQNVYKTIPTCQNP